MITPELQVPTEGSSKSAQVSYTHSYCGRQFTLPDGDDIESYSILYIGSESMDLTCLMMTLNQNVFYTYDPNTQVARREKQDINKMLMKRYFLVQKAKEADIVGIVVGTLGVAHYLEAIQRLKDILKKSGKKHYTFVVGKLNVPKLANFMEVDIFVLVACGQSSLLDSKEFYKPVVTPFEMEVACCREWSGHYTTDFTQLLPGEIYNHLQDTAYKYK